MTVCVATIAANGLIIGAADRMLTSGIKKTEPESTKIYHALTNKPAISLMWAGSASIQGRLWEEFSTRILADPDAYPRVRDAVDLYCSIYGAIRAQEAETMWLAPFGLTRQSLVSRETKLADDVQGSLQEQMVHYRLRDDDDIQALIVGHDPDGLAHIWSVTNGRPCCHDIEGFAAIGIGTDHADSHFRFSGYTRTRDPQEAVILTYVAKRRAEVAPGVGRYTDMFPREAVNRTWSAIPVDWMGEFDTIYDELVAAETIALRAVVTRTRSFFEKIFNLVPKPEEAP